MSYEINSKSEFKRITCLLKNEIKEKDDLIKELEGKLKEAKDLIKPLAFNQYWSMAQMSEIITNQKEWLKNQDKKDVKQSDFK